MHPSRHAPTAPKWKACSVVPRACCRFTCSYRASNTLQSAPRGALPSMNAQYAHCHFRGPWVSLAAAHQSLVLQQARYKAGMLGRKVYIQKRFGGIQSGTCRLERKPIFVLPSQLLSQPQIHINGQLRQPGPASELFRRSCSSRRVEPTVRL